jgi:hypothetical protein
MSSALSLHPDAAPATHPEPAPTWAARLLGFPTLLVAGLAVIVLFCVPRSMADPDIWWHLRDVQVQLATHSFLHRDLFSFTAAGSPWMNHEWIAELPFYLGWHLAGATGVYVVTLLAIEAVLLGVFLLAWQSSRNPVAAAFVAIAATIFATVSFGPRTLLFGWICLVLELLLLRAAETRPRLVWCLPVLFALWVNTHGSWMIGLVLLALYIAAGSIPVHLGAIVNEPFPPRHRRNLLLAAALSVAALFLNPYGWRLVAYPVNLAFHQKLNVANVEEWRGLDFGSPRGLVLLAVLAALALWQLYRPRTWRTIELLWLFLGIYSAFHYTRFLFLFAILAAPIAARGFPPRPPREDDAPARPLVNFAILLMLLGFVTGRLRNRDDFAEKAMRKFPAEALPMLQTFPFHGRVFNEYLWGGYLIWNVPHIPVFVDSRVDIFEYNGTFKDYLDIIHIENTLALLDQHQIQYVFFERDAPLVYLLTHTPGWKTDWQRDNFILLERTTRPW